MDIISEIDELKKILDISPEKREPSIEKDLPIFEIDREGNFTSVPPIMEEITGFSKEELYLLSLQNVVFYEDRPNVIRTIEAVMSGSKILISEIEIFSERTGSHPVELILLPKMKDTKITGAWGAVRDIQGRKYIEDKLEATREIQEASRQFLQDFVSLMAREIRQPMTTILLTLEMLDSDFFGDLNDQQKMKIDQLIALVGRMKTILHEGITASRDVNEEIKLDRRMVPMKTVVSDVLRAKEEKLSDKNIKVSTNLPKDNLNTPADRKMIFQAIATLVDNSIEISPESGILMVELDRKDDEVQFSIADSGPGLDEDEVASIFDKIHDHQETERGSFSEGLNMYMTKRIIETHGGRIWCESFPGLGSTYLFTVPLKKEVEKYEQRSYNDS